MARQAIWVHGNAVVQRFSGGSGISPHVPAHQMDNVLESNRHTEWTDVVGMHRDNGVTFRGKANNTNTFHVSIPTPSWRDGVRAQLVMIGLLFTSAVPAI